MWTTPTPFSLPLLYILSSILPPPAFPPAFPPLPSLLTVLGTGWRSPPTTTTSVLATPAPLQPGMQTLAVQKARLSQRQQWWWAGFPSLSLLLGWWRTPKGTGQGEGPHLLPLSLAEPNWSWSGVALDFTSPRVSWGKQQQWARGRNGREREMLLSMQGKGGDSYLLWGHIKSSLLLL